MLVEELLDQKLEERLSKQAAGRNYNFFRPVGQFIEHVDTVNFRMDSDGTFHFDNVGQVNGEPDASRMPHTETEDTDPTPAPPLEGRGVAAPSQPASYSDEQVDVVEKLKPIFYNNEENVRLFLNEIEGMQPNDITVLVNKWVVEKRISDYGNSRKGVLWEILNTANLYTRSRQNWCQRVD